FIITLIAQLLLSIFFFQAEDGIRDFHVTGVQTCALPISHHPIRSWDAQEPDNRLLWQLLGLLLRFRLPHILDREYPVISVGQRRSEERRVGKECRSRWSRYYEKKKYKKETRQERKPICEQ